MLRYLCWAHGWATIEFCIFAPGKCLPFYWEFARRVWTVFLSLSLSLHPKSQNLATIAHNLRTIPWHAFMHHVSRCVFVRFEWADVWFLIFNIYCDDKIATNTEYTRIRSSIFFVFVLRINNYDFQEYGRKTKKSSNNICWMHTVVT